MKFSKIFFFIECNVVYAMFVVVENLQPFKNRVDVDATLSKSFVLKTGECDQHAQVV